MSAQQAKRANVVMFGLIRDAQGRPKIDGPAAELHPAIKLQLTHEERQELGAELTAQDHLTMAALLQGRS